MSSSDEPLPVILVSACDLETATEIISELVGEEGEEVGAGARAWRLSNKYYEARALLCALPDGAQPPAEVCERAHAHVVLLKPNEVYGAALRARAGAVGGAPLLAVRLALVRVGAGGGGGGRAPRQLRAEAAELRYELVPLRAPSAPSPASDSDSGDDEEPAGVARAVAALHAHTWPNLRLRALNTPPAAAAPEGRGEGDGVSDGESEEDEEAALERAELFAEALGALGAAGRGEGGDGEEGAEARAARVARAEALVGAFCAALGAHPRPL